MLQQLFIKGPKQEVTLAPARPGNPESTVHGDMYWVQYQPVNGPTNRSPAPMPAGQFAQPNYAPTQPAPFMQPNTVPVPAAPFTQPYPQAGSFTQPYPQSAPAPQPYPLPAGQSMMLAPPTRQ